MKVSLEKQRLSVRTILGYDRSSNIIFRVDLITVICFLTTQTGTTCSTLDSVFGNSLGKTKK